MTFINIFCHFRAAKINFWAPELLAKCNSLPFLCAILPQEDNSTRHFCHDLELGGGDLISSPVYSIASLVSPKKSYGPNSVGKNYFSATPFFTFSKIATGGHNA